jgi:hypothetical protein
MSKNAKFVVVNNLFNYFTVKSELGHEFMPWIDETIPPEACIFSSREEAEKIAKEIGDDFFVREI